jgi:hypothetical protein
MSFPVFASGDVLNASDMNGVGMWLVKSHTITGTSPTVAVTGAFSADYDNYRVIVRGGTMASTGVIALQLGASTTGYLNNLLFSNFAIPAVSQVSNNNVVGSWTFAGVGDTNYMTFDAEIYSPFLAQRSRFKSLYSSVSDAGVSQGFHNVATSYTGFTLSSTVNFTGGVVEVFGYRN